MGDSTATGTKNPILGAKATPANVAIVQSVLAGYKLPYASISSTSTQATIAQTLLAFPQYNGVSDTWGQNVGNISYNSLQASLAQRPAHGLSYTIITPGRATLATMERSARASICLLAPYREPRRRSTKTALSAPSPSRI